MTFCLAHADRFFIQHLIWQMRFEHTGHRDNQMEAVENGPVASVGDLADWVEMRRNDLGCCSAGSNKDASTVPRTHRKNSAWWDNVVCPST
jgi:hypothetical protein